MLWSSSPTASRARALVLVPAAPGDGGHQSVLVGVDVLVLVHEDVPIAGEQAVAHASGSIPATGSALQQVQGLGDQPFEVRRPRVSDRRPLRERRPTRRIAKP